MTALPRSRRVSPRSAAPTRAGPRGPHFLPSVYHGQCPSDEPGEQIQNPPALRRPELRPPRGNAPPLRRPQPGSVSGTRRGDSAGFRARRLSPKLSDLQTPHARAQRVRPRNRKRVRSLPAPRGLQSRPRLRPGRRGQPRAPNPARVGAERPQRELAPPSGLETATGRPCSCGRAASTAGPRAVDRAPRTVRGAWGPRGALGAGRADGSDEHRAGSVSLTRERHSSEAGKTAHRVALRHPQRVAPTDERTRQPPPARRSRKARVLPACGRRDGAAVRGEASSCRPGPSRPLPAPPGPSRSLPVPPGAPSPEPARLG